MPDTRSLDKLIAKKQGQQQQSVVPRTSLQKLVAKKVEKPEGLIGKVGDALTTVGNITSYPQRKLFGMMLGKETHLDDLESGATGDDVAGAMGMQPGLARATVGLGLDLVADPMNFVPVGLVGKALGKGLDAAKAVSKAADVIPGVQMVKKIGTELVDGVADKFVQHAGTSKFVDATTGLSYQDKARLHASAVQSTTAAARAKHPTAAASAKAAQAAKAAETKTFHADIVKNFGSATPQPGYRIPTAYTKTLGKTYFPEAIAKDLEKSATFTGSVPENFWTDTMKLWKSYATSVNPSHHFVNMLGNMQNMYLGGIEGHKLVSEYTMAKKALDNPALIAPEHWKAMTRYGVIGDNATFGGSMAPTGRVRATVMRGKLNPLNPENVVAEKMREVGTNWVEEPARVALFMNRIKKGESPEKAALAVKKYLFDYSELTDTERKLRDYAFPFYTFTRKNLPLQIEAVMNDPRRVNKIGDVLNFFSNLSPDAANATQPDYLSKEGFVPAPVTGANGDPYLMRLALPIQDINKLSSFNDAFESMGSMVNPIGKVAGELLAGHEFRGDIPIWREKGYQNPAVWANVADTLGLDNIPGVSRALGLVNTPEGTKQRDLQAYAMRQIPFGNWLGRSIAPPEREGGLNPAVNTLMRVLGATPVQLGPAVQGREMGRRVKEQSHERRMQRLVLDQ